LSPNLTLEVFDWEGFENDQSNSATVQSVLEKRIFKKIRTEKEDI